MPRRRTILVEFQGVQLALRLASDYSDSVASPRELDVLTAIMRDYLAQMIASTCPEPHAEQCTVDAVSRRVSPETHLERSELNRKHRVSTPRRSDEADEEQSTGGHS